MLWSTLLAMTGGPTESFRGFMSRLFETDFMRRGDCVSWRPEIVWLHVISDALIMLSYYSIPLALIYFVRRRTDLAFNWMFVMFATFILACGTTHLFNIVAFWYPVYRADGAVKLITALVSAATAVALWPLIPRALSLPSPAQLRRANDQLTVEIQERRRAEQALAASRDDLERRVIERTAELSMVNQRLEERNLEMRQITEDLRQSENRFRIALSESPVIVFTQDHDLRYTFIYNPKFGWTEEQCIGATDLELFGQQADRMLEPKRRALATGEVVREEISLELSGEERHFILVIDPQHDDLGNIIGITGVAMDITDRKQAEQHQALLVAELDHRVKNNLANVMALAERSIKRATTIEEFSKPFTERIRAMASTHEALSRTRWKGDSILTMIRLALQAYLVDDPNCIRISGDDIPLSPRASSALCMALNELATNATKYGALSTPGGHVNLNWTIHKDISGHSRITVNWIERGGPPVTRPTRRGLGIDLIEGGIAYELKGAVTIEYHPEGVHATMSFPVLKEET